MQILLLVFEEAKAILLKQNSQLQFILAAKIKMKNDDTASEMHLLYTFKCSPFF